MHLSVPLYNHWPLAIWPAGSWTCRKPETCSHHPVGLHLGSDKKKDRKGQEVEMRQSYCMIRKIRHFGVCSYCGLDSFIEGNWANVFRRLCVEISEGQDSTIAATHSVLSFGLTGFPQSRFSYVQIQTLVQQHPALILRTNTKNPLVWYTHNRLNRNDRKNRENVSVYQCNDTQIVGVCVCVLLVWSCILPQWNSSEGWGSGC